MRAKGDHVQRYAPTLARGRNSVKGGELTSGIRDFAMVTFSAATQLAGTSSSMLL